MLALTHTIISLPFAYYLDNPLIIFVSAAILHLLADSLLHWNLFPDQTGKHFYPLVAVDIVLGLAATWIITGGQLFALPVLTAIAGGNAPDVAQQLWDMLGKSRQERWCKWAIPLFRFHDKLQLETPQIGRGMLWQIILMAAAVLLVMTSSNIS